LENSNDYKKFILNQDDIGFLKKLIKHAGLRALEFQQKGMDLDISRKEDSSIVTEADLWVQNYLVENIAKKYPTFNFIYEENFDRSSVTADENGVNVIIDPIDGTAMFSMGLPIWCISIGIFDGYKPVYGFVYSPASDLFFYNDNDSSYLNEKPVATDPEMKLDSESNIFHSSELKGKIDINFQGKARNLGSTALHAALVTDNVRNRVLAFAGQSYLWDWAGAIPVIEKAGGIVRYIDGSEIDYREIIENRYAMKNFIVATSRKDFSLMREIFIPLA